MYRAPLRELRFVLDELLQSQALAHYPGLADYSSDVAEAILGEAARFAETILDPINRSGDEQGARWTPEGVVTAPGFRDAYRQFAAGGWSQLKFTPTSRLEFNGAFGADNPFARDIHSLSLPVGVYPSVLTANRSEMLNFIYRPRSDLLLSGEYRHLRTSQIGNYYSADHVNFMMGVLF